jgi:rhodanese-related sulfurtransferase
MTGRRDPALTRRKDIAMTRNVPSRRRTEQRAIRSDDRAVPYELRPRAKPLLHSKHALAVLLIAGAIYVACSALAVAGTEPAAPAAAARPAATAAPAATVAAPMSQEALLQHQSQHPDHLLVLDVRTPQEYAEGHVPGAVNVPFDQLASRLAEVPKDKDLVLYCKSGRRAGIAADTLAANGYTRLSHLEGDMNAWVEKGRPIAKP